VPTTRNVDEQDLDICPAGGSKETTFVSAAEPGGLKPSVGNLVAGDDSSCQITQVAKEATLSFCARDLLIRLVRATATIRRDPTNPAEPLWFHNNGCVEVTVQVADVNELLQSGLIECESEQVYRVSAAGKRIAGLAARADAARSAATY